MLCSCSAVFCSVCSPTLFIHPSPDAEEPKVFDFPTYRPGCALYCFVLLCIPDYCFPGSLFPSSKSHRLHCVCCLVFLVAASPPLLLRIVHLQVLAPFVSMPTCGRLGLLLVRVAFGGLTGLFRYHAPYSCLCSSRIKGVAKND